MHELTVREIDATGVPDTGDLVSVFSVDDGRKFLGYPELLSRILQVQRPGWYLRRMGLVCRLAAQRFLRLPTGRVGGVHRVGGDCLCTGLPGYDGPTGLGTPNGSGAF
jgi:hypothetical protein